jgi:hypothetical protein
MRLKCFVIISLLGLSLCAMAQVTVSIAPDAPSKEDVQKLFDVMSSRDQVRQVMQQLWAQMRALNREEIKKRRPEVSDEELASAERESEELIKNFPLDEMLADMVPVYQRHFTKSDVEALTAFYSSPAGQKFVHEMPAVTAETMRAVYPRIQAELDALLKKAEEKKEAPKK